MKRTHAIQSTVFFTTSTLVLLGASLAFAVEPNTRTFTAGQSTKVQGVIVAHEGSTLKLRGDDDAIGTIDLTQDTKIQLKKGFLRGKSAMDQAALVPGLHIQVDGEGNEKGDLVAKKVIFDPNSMRASRQIDARVSPLEARTGSVENRTGQLENRAGQLENREGQLEDQQKQTQQTVGQVQTQVGQVKTSADQANQGVTDVNARVTNLDNYESKDSVTVYFKINSTTLSAEAKKDLDDIAQKALNEKGYVIEVAGFADKTGGLALNQDLSERRANAVIRYLEQQGNIPIHRILTPAGMGISHEAGDNGTAAGRKLNRRVEVKVLVNQGVVSGMNQQPGANPSATGAATPAPR
jgi:OmpA-OmpF porin, OOP family